MSSRVRHPDERPTPVWTVGHSTRTFEAFAALLETHRVDAVADVRAFPGSRRHPHFHREALAEALPSRGIAYHHLPSLGGRRRPRPDAPATGWRAAGFHAYADYMTTPDFSAALDDLEDLVEAHRCAVMCAEVVPWRCHRMLISDALVARGHRVWHIVSADAPGEHVLTSFARVRDGRVSYTPGTASSGSPDRPIAGEGAETPLEQQDLFGSPEGDQCVTRDTIAD